MDTARDWGLPVDDEATLRLPDRKPREARGRRGRQTVISFLTQMGESPPGWKLQRHHTQKRGFCSHDMPRHLQIHSATLSHGNMHTPQSQSHTLLSLIALVTGIAKDASRMNQALETEAGENGSWKDAKSWTYPLVL